MGVRRNGEREVMVLYVLAGPANCLWRMAGGGDCAANCTSRARWLSVEIGLGGEDGTTCISRASWLSVEIGLGGEDGTTCISRARWLSVEIGLGGEDGTTCISRARWLSVEIGCEERMVLPVLAGPASRAS